MQNAIEIPLSDTEKTVLSTISKKAGEARRTLEDQLLRVEASAQAALATIAQLHGHTDGRLEVIDGRLYVFPPTEQQERTDA